MTNKINIYILYIIKSLFTKNKIVMESVKTESSGNHIVESILTSLKNLRENDQDWMDGEEEDEEIESSVFKKAEALKCFLLAKQYNILSPLSDKVLTEDILNVLNEVKKNGFYPSPYSYLPSAVDDQYTDFAAFCINFCDLAYNAFKNHQEITNLSKEISKRAIQFLTSETNYAHDKDGIRWGGTTMYMKKKMVKEYFTDVYFTSQVLISLSNILTRSISSLKSDKRESIVKIINEGIAWIIGRIKNNVICGNEEKNDTKLIYTTWGLKAYIETLPYQDKDNLELMKQVVTQYIRDIGKKVDEKGVKIEQIYLAVLSPTNDGRPTSYDDRTGWGGVFLTLVSLKKIKEFETLLEEVNYYKVLEKVYYGILALRNNTTKLWYNDFYIISIHSLIIEGFLEFEKHIKDFSFELKLTSGMIRRAIKETLQDELVVSTIQQTVYSKLQEFSQKAERARNLDNAIASITE